MDKREYLYIPKRFEEKSDSRRRWSDTESLMVAPPNEEPAESLSSMFAEVDWLRSLVDELPSRKRRIIEAIYYQRLPLRKIGKELGLSKTHVARIRDEALGNLRELLENGTSAVIPLDRSSSDNGGN